MMLTEPGDPDRGQGHCEHVCRGLSLTGRVLWLGEGRLLVAGLISGSVHCSRVPGVGSSALPGSTTADTALLLVVARGELIAGALLEAEVGQVGQCALQAGRGGGVSHGCTTGEVTTTAERGGAGRIVTNTRMASRGPCRRVVSGPQIWT